MVLQLEAFEITQKFSILITEFKVSYGWVCQFLNFRPLLIYRRTAVSQKLPEEYEEKLINFQKFEILLRKKHGFVLSQIGNDDLTPLWLDKPGFTTAEPVSERSFQVRMTGADKQQCTMMLAVTPDSHQLPPFVIKKLPKDRFLPRIIVRVQGRGWMTEGCIFMVECGVGKVVRCFVMQACHVGFRQLSWTYDRKGESKD